MNKMWNNILNHKITTHIVDLWPLYFADGFNEIDKDKFDKANL